MRCPILLSVALLAALPAVADTVHLENGNSFEGVVTELSDSRVVIRLAFGQLELSRASVARVERASSDQQEYFRRADALAADPEATGGEWLALSQWARRRGLVHSASEAAKTAATLAPALPELAATMRGLGYVLDEELDAWVPQADFMRRRGFRFEEGQWITREESLARARAREEERRERRAEARDERLARAVEMLALSQLESARDEPAEAVRELPASGFPVAAFPGPIVLRGGFFSPRHAPAPPAVPPSADPRFRQDPFRRPPPSVTEQLLRRQPGSLIPLLPPRHHQGTIVRSPHGGR